MARDGTRRTSVGRAGVVRVREHGRRAQQVRERQRVVLQPQHRPVQQLLQRARDPLPRPLPLDRHRLQMRIRMRRHNVHVHAHVHYSVLGTLTQTRQHQYQEHTLASSAKREFSAHRRRTVERARS